MSVTPVIHHRPRVVIVGAGFGGLAAARELAKDDVDVTIVDRHNFHTFQPLLYQVATAGLNAADVAYPVRGIFQRQANVDFRLASVTGVDWSTRTVRLDDGDELEYEYLVIAAGATTNYFGVEGATDYGFPLYSLSDAIRLRNHILERFESAAADRELIDDGALTFVVVGGGPTGVEVAGALVELFERVLRRDFRHLDTRRAKVVLVEMDEHLLGPFAPISRKHAKETLEGRGVHVLLDDAVTKVTPNRVILRSGGVLEAHTLVWAAGVRANPLADALGIETTNGARIVVDVDTRVPGHRDVFAVGDVAAVVDRRKGVLPQLAPVAIQSGHHAGKEIRRAIAGDKGKPFRYVNKGTMATIGRRAAVAELPTGVKLRGSLAWLAWLGLHIFYLIGFRNRLSVMLNWAWNYVTYDRGPRIITADPNGDRPVAPSATPPVSRTTPL